MPKVTMKDIARRAGVSQPLVSLIMNNSSLKVSEKSREKVLRIARELDYTPNQAARSLKTGKTNVIGITSGTGIPVRRAFNDPYFSALFTGIGDAVADNGYRLLFQQDDGFDAAGSALEMLTANMVDGVIFLLLTEYMDDFLQKQLPRLKSMGMPYRIITTLNGVEGTPITGVDSRGGAEAAAAHLLGHGYRDVGFLYYECGDNRFNRECREGFGAAVRTAGLADSDVISLPSKRVYSDGAYDVIDELLKSGRSVPRALFCTQVRLAHGVMRRLAEAGIRVPDDCAVSAYGIEEYELCMFSGLTAAHMPASDMGRHAAESLLHTIDGHEDGNDVLKPELKIRTSCGCKYAASTKYQISSTKQRQKILP